MLFEKKIEHYASRMSTENAVRFVATYLLCKSSTNPWVSRISSQLWGYHIEYRTLKHKATLEYIIDRFVAAEGSKLYDKQKKRYYDLMIRFEDLKTWHETKKPKLP